MDNKRIWMRLFVSGIVLGGLIASATLFLNARLPLLTLRTTPSPIADKNLCEILTKESIQVHLSYLPIETAVPVSAGISTGANCIYFLNSNIAPFLTFFYNNPDLNALKEQRQSFGATFKDIFGIGDEAFFSELHMPDEVIFNSIYFRVGGFGYFLESSKLSEAELVIIATEAVSKLPQ